jgi:cyclopropane fatty-acyl-phospholipid synthase-like methyltransferase
MYEVNGRKRCKGNGRHGQGIFPFLPYIFQDIWEIGSDPDVIIDIISKYFDNYIDLKVLDLGCGKGAVSIKIAQELNCNCHGIDAVPQFIDEAGRKAREYEVSHLCKFEVGDMIEAVNTLTTYNIIILGAIGPVFGDYNLTLNILSKHLNKHGLIIIDDSYIENNSEYSHPQMQKQETSHQQIVSSGMQLVLR